MTKTNSSELSEILGPDFSKLARAFQKVKEKEKTPEFIQLQKEAAIYLRVSSEMQRDGFSIEAQKLECMRYIHNEGYHVSASLTAEAVEALGIGKDGAGRSLFRVERT